MKMVTVYKSHSNGCKYSTERYSKKCDCTLWLQYSFDRKQTKKSAKTNNWDVANKLAHQKQLELERMLLGESVLPAVRMTLREAVELYLVAKKEVGWSEGTVRNDRRQMADLQAYCAKKGVTLLRDVSTSLLEEYQRTWSGCVASTRQVYQTKVGAFFNWAHKKKTVTGLTDNPYIGVDRVQVKDKKQTPPYTPEEMAAILAAIPKAGAKHGWTPWKTLRINALVLLQRWSGLRASDAVCLERSRLDTKTGELGLYQIKTGEYVGVALPAFVVEAILAVPNDNPAYFFWGGTGQKDTAAACYSHAFKQVLDESGVKQTHNDGDDIHGTTHRLRDTFAISLLEAGVSMEYVSQLLGHSSIDTTKAAYNPWSRVRQNMLNQEAKKAWTKVPEMEAPATVTIQ